MTTMDPVLINDAFRGFEDDVAGAITAQTPIAAVDTNWTQQTDTIFHVAMLVTETAGNNGSVADRLEYNLNSGGWTDVTASTPIQSTTPTNCTTTNGTDYGTTALTTGGTTERGLYNTDGADESSNVLSNSSQETVWCLTIDSAQVADGDTIQLRITDAGTAITDTTIPTITVDEPIGVALNNGSFVLSGNALQVDHGVPLALGTFGLTGYSGASALYLEPSPGSFVLSGSTLGVELGTIVELNLGSYALNGFALGVDLGSPLTLGTFVWGGLDLTIIAGTDVGLDPGSFSVTSQPLLVDQSSPLALGTYVWSGSSLNAIVEVPLALGTFTLTGYSGAAALYLEPSPGSFTLSELPLGVSVDAELVALNQGSYSVDGFDLDVAHTAPLALGSFLWSGLTLGVIEGSQVPLDAGSFVWTGNALQVDQGSPLTLGSFSLSELDLTVDLSTLVGLDLGSFTQSGFDLVISEASNVGLALESYSLSGLDMSISEGTTNVPLDLGAYTLNGQTLDISLPTGTPVALNLGNFTIVGYSGASFLYFAPDTGSFSWNGFDLGYEGPEQVALAKGSFIITGYTAFVVEGAGTLTGTIDTTPDPDEVNFTTSETFNGTIYWTITASATPPALTTSPPGFATSGLLDGSFTLVGSVGSTSIDASSIAPGTYYLHAVGYVTALTSFTTIETIEFNLGVELGQGTYSVNGFELQTSDRVPLNQGVFSLEGHELGLNNEFVPLVRGIFTVGDKSLGIDINTPVPLALGSYVHTGNSLLAAPIIKMLGGSFNVLGRDVGVQLTLPQLDVSLDLGAYAWQGYAVGTGTQDYLALDSDSYALSGYDVGLLEGTISELNIEGFSLAGYDWDISLTFLGEPNYATPGRSARSGKLLRSDRGGTLVRSKSLGTVNPTTEN